MILPSWQYQETPRVSVNVYPNLIQETLGNSIKLGFHLGPLPASTWFLSVTNVQRRKVISKGSGHKKGQLDFLT